MSSLEKERLYNLLPAVYRAKDAAQGEVLRALLGVIDEELQVVEEDIARLYDNWFIETCDEWLVPYVGDLLGVRSLHPVGTRASSQRAWVANTLAYRRRKGTAPVLEQLARDVTGWTARVVEFFQLLAATQHVNHVRLTKGGTIDLRDSNALELLNGPFDNAVHTAEARRISSNRGRYNIPNLGLFLWRLQSYAVTRGTARLVSSPAQAHYSFNPLGQDFPLFNRPISEIEITHLAEEINVPDRLRRRALYDELERRRQSLADGSSEGEVAQQGMYFGVQPVVRIYKDGAEIPAAEILVCDLANWRTPPSSKTYVRRADGVARAMPISVAIDPELGRLIFPAGVTPAKVQVSYSYGFSADIGAGPYDRQASVEQWHDSMDRPVTWQIGVTKDPATHAAAQDPNLLVQTLAEAIQAWNAHVAAHPGAYGVIAVMDSDSYVENLTAGNRVAVPEGSKLAIVAAQWPQVEAPDAPGVMVRETGAFVPGGVRPHLDGNVQIKGTASATALNPGELVIDGLLIEGRVRILAGNLGRLRLHHCTIVPGPQSFRVNATNTQLQIDFDHCICGGVDLAATVRRLRVAASLIDAGDGTAVAAPGTEVEVQAGTIFGAVRAESLEAGNAIFTGPVQTARRQVGCVRFSYVPPGSVTPRRYHCQPDLEISQRIAAAEKKAKVQNAVLTAAEKEEIRRKAVSLIVPRFTASEYGNPAYGQLHRLCPQQIRAGADPGPGGEMGVFNELKNPEREANLRVSLEEYLRFGLEAGFFFVT